jgi:hypothetical protein
MWILTIGSVVLQFVEATWDSTPRFARRFPVRLSIVTVAYGSMKRPLLVAAVIALYLLHQDFWFWRASAPLAFGFLPIGLFYHVCYTLVISVLMWLLVRHTWPSHLEEGAGLESANPQSAIRNPQSGGTE